MIVFTVANFKGGVAKTSTAINLAHAFADIHGLRTLLIDNDGQADTSKFFKCYNSAGIGVPDVLEHKAELSGAIKKTAYENLWLAPTSRAAEKCNQNLTKNANPQTLHLLAMALEPQSARFDVCVIDNPTTLTIAAMAAIVAADHVIVPVKIDAFALENTAEMLEQIKNLADATGCAKPAHVLATMYDNCNANRTGLVYLRKYTKGDVLDTVIRKSDKATESTFARKPIREYSRRSPMATGYKNLAAELLQKCAEKTNG